jgi:hypothetical protein
MDDNSEPSSINRAGTKVNSPAFADPQPTPDPQTFVVQHPSDQPLYCERIDSISPTFG